MADSKDQPQKKTVARKPKVDTAPLKKRSADLGAAALDAALSGDVPRAERLAKRGSKTNGIIRRLEGSWTRRKGHK